MKFFERRRKAKLYQQWVDRAGLSPDAIPKEVSQAGEEEPPLEETLSDGTEEEELAEENKDAELSPEKITLEVLSEDKPVSEQLIREEPTVKAKTFDEQYHTQMQISAESEGRAVKKSPLPRTAKNRPVDSLPGIGTAIRNLNPRQKRQLILFVILIVALTVFWVGIILLINSI